MPLSIARSLVTKLPGNKILGNELLVGLTLAIVVLPQAIAFSTTLAGVPPYFGIYAAIWGVIITALFNPSRVFHGGPNSTMSAVMGVTLLPIAPQFGQDYMGYALSLVLMAAVVQLGFVLIRPLARLLDLMSEAVINGMIAGIGLFLIFKSITAFGGLPINTESEWPLWITWQSFIAVLEFGNLYAIQIGMLTLMVAIVVRAITPLRNWAILAGIIAGTLLSEYLNTQYGLENTLIEQTADFSAVSAVLPSLPLFTQEALPDIIAIMPGAVTLAMLGLFQTVAAMRRMNRKTGQHVDSGKGVLADTVGNFALPFLSSLPTCASFNRMWLMHSMGAKTLLVPLSSALFLLLFLLFFAPVIAIIPIPAMAAVIMIVGANMIKWIDIRPHFSNRSEAIVFITAFVSVHIFGLFGAVLIGSVLALLHFKWRKLHPGISLENGVLKIRGSLYYGSLPFIERMVAESSPSPNPLCIDLTETTYIDAEARRWLRQIKQGNTIIITSS